MTSSAPVWPPSPFSPGSSAGVPGGWVGITRGRDGDTVIKPTLGSVASPAIDAAMLHTLGLTRAADEAGEVPVDVIVLLSEGVILVETVNTRRTEHNPTTRAEIHVLHAADAALSDSHLDGCTLVVTPEPYTMCTDAIVLTQVTRLVLEAWEPRTGACDLVHDVAHNTRTNHQVEVRAGLRTQESQEFLTVFFTDRR